MTFAIGIAVGILIGVLGTIVVLFLALAYWAFAVVDDVAER